MNSLMNVGKDQGILTQEEIQFLDNQIVKTIRPVLQARKIFPVFNVPNAGYMSIRHYNETDMSEAALSMYGDSQADDVTLYEYNDLIIPTISKTFKIRWRDLLASRNVGQGLDAQYVSNAARQIAQVEDRLMLSGECTTWSALGIEGLSTATGRQTQASAGAWPANAITDINAARNLLQAAGFVDKPFVLIGPVAEIKKLDGQLTNTEITWRTFLLKNNLVSKIIESTNVYAADCGEDSVLLVQPDAMNFDLVQAMPPKVGWWEYKDGNMYGYVRECVVPRGQETYKYC